MKEIVEQGKNENKNISYDYTKFRIRDFGFITDIKCYSKEYGVFKSYTCWYHMIERCYDKTLPSYINYGGRGVMVCDEWKLYSNFKKWYDDNCIDGYEIDKDIKGGMIYSPQTCIFISKEHNISEAMSRRDYTKNSGKNNAMYKSFEYYESNPVDRTFFKNKCKREGVDFESFKEIWNGDKVRNGRKLFTYVKYNENECVVDRQYKKSNDYLYYSKHPSTRDNFERWCLRNGFDLNMFHEEYVGTKLYKNNKKKKMYIYTIKPNL